MNCPTLLIAMLALGPFLVPTKAVGGGPSLPNPEALLRRSDVTRNAWETFSNTTVIRNYEDGQLKDEGSFEVSIKGASKTLVKFLDPDVKGEYLLMLDDAMWIYLPNTRKPIRITPLQRLLGNASNGDVARTHYAEDYSATAIREDILDGTPCYVLELSPRRDGATYNRITYWIGRDSEQPRRAEIYLASGKHYKTIEYDRYTRVEGHLLLQQMTIVDRLREGRKTIMSFSDYRQRDLPDKYFNKDYMENLR